MTGNLFVSNSDNKRDHGTHFCTELLNFSNYRNCDQGSDWDAVNSSAHIFRCFRQSGVKAIDCSCCRLSTEKGQD
jgi:hypothetical protein